MNGKSRVLSLVVALAAVMPLGGRIVDPAVFCHEEIAGAAAAGGCGISALPAESAIAAFGGLDIALASGPVLGTTVAAPFAEPILVGGRTAPASAEPGSIVLLGSALLLTAAAAKRRSLRRRS